MDKSHLTRLTACFLAVLLVLCACAAPESAPDTTTPPEVTPAVPSEDEPAPVTDVVPREVLEAEPSTGSILLCGEAHRNPDHLKRELELWEACYEKGVRHFIKE